MAAIHVPDRDHFVQAYKGRPPWDIGKPQSVFVDVADQITGYLLDAGCGTGDIALYFASRGVKVMGIDYLEAPIEQARRKAQEQNLAVDFRVLDALELKTLPDRFDAVVDCGLFHVFSDQDRRTYVKGLTRVVKEGGQLFLLCFSDEEPGTQGPRRISMGDLYDAFAEGWMIEYIQPARIEIRPDFKEIGFSEGGPKAWFMLAKRSG